jgi:catechol 2,3-dioxygenase-like lactoylglutathione lyase family enzyme
VHLDRAHLVFSFELSFSEAVTSGRRTAFARLIAAGWDGASHRHLESGTTLDLLVTETGRDNSSRGTISFVIGRLHHVILDCDNPGVVADFYAQVLGQAVTYRSDDFCVVSRNDHTSGLAFQLAPQHLAPTWPSPDVPQQIHLDVMVDDLAAAGEAVLALGARHLQGSVYADPAGHPFCLIPRPAWAPPVGAG